jgi:hypothetical protein
MEKGNMSIKIHGTDQVRGHIDNFGRALTISLYFLFNHSCFLDYLN